LNSKIYFEFVFSFILLQCYEYVSKQPKQTYLFQNKPKNVNCTSAGMWTDSPCAAQADVAGTFGDSKDRY
jgi:hypothetical protein